ncbi:MAG: VWA domain-containing protein [Chloroflexales bacterium]|nr:VWA domain-containing protein [Chloroflexales bacterium]
MRRICLVVLAALLLSILSACGIGGDGATPNGGPTGVPANALVLRMLYGSEKELWLKAATETFNQQQSKSSSGKPIFIEAVPMGSADSMERILSGQDQAQIWSPASSILVPIANERWAAAHNGEQLVDSAPPPLVLSPVVIAMWRPMAEALGWPAKPLGWGDIAELAASGKTWADFNRPEWGPFQFGHTHPDYSNSGITSILATAYAGAGKTRGLTVADVQSAPVAKTLGDVERAVIHYGESTGFFGRQMFSRGPAYLSAAVLYENLVVEANDKTKYPNLSLPVVAVYPKEGTFWSDHPFAVLKTSTVSDEQRQAAETYRAFLMSQPQQQAALQFGFRPADPSVAIGAPISEANGVDPKQPQTLLEVPRADVTTAVRQLWSAQKKRVEVQIVLDTSGSMEDEGRLESAKTALRTFIGQLADGDSLGITVFNNAATELTPLGEIGPKRQEVLDRVGGLIPSGGTRLVDSVQEAYKTMQAQPPGQAIRAVIVLTDGADNRSTTTQEQLLSLLGADKEGYGIKVFTIAYGTGTDVNTDLLKSIADASGAKSYTSNPSDIDRVYKDIATFF